MLTVVLACRRPLKRWPEMSPPPQTNLPSSAKRETDTHMKINRIVLELK